MNPIDQTRLVKKYAGKWVALDSSGENVISSGTTLRAAKKAADKKGSTDAYFTRFPKEPIHFIGAHITS